MAGVVGTKEFGPLGRVIIVISASTVPEVFPRKLFERLIPAYQKSRNDLLKL